MGDVAAAGPLAGTEKTGSLATISIVFPGLGVGRLGVHVHPSPGSSGSQLSLPALPRADPHAAPDGGLAASAGGR